MGDEVKLPTAADILSLPSWARVAFAARCARSIGSGFKLVWPEAPDGCVQAVENAIHVAEQSASIAYGRGEIVAAARIANTADEAARAALAAARTATNSVASVIARAAAAAARTASATVAALDFDAATRAALAAAHADVTRVFDAASAVGVCRGDAPSIAKDFQTIVDLARAEGWTDDTPVPPEVFGPLDEPSPPIGQDPQVKFALRAIAEPGVSAETVARHVVEVFKALNEYTLAKYGVRVTKDEFRRLVYEHSGARV